MNTYFLLMVVVIYLLLSLFITKGDLFFPSNIVMLMYLLSLFFLIGEMKRWLGNISFKSMVLLVLGLTIYLGISLMTFSFFSRITFPKSQKNNSLKVFNSQLLPVIDNKVTLFIIVYEVFSTLKYYLDVQKSSSAIGVYSSFGEMIGNYRNAAAYGSLNIRISALSAYNYQIMLALAYVYASIVIQYLVLNQKTSLWWKILHYLPIIIYGFCSILTGGRNPLINLCLAIIVMYFIKQRQFNGRRLLKFKTICKLVLGGTVALILFSSLGEW